MVSLTIALVAVVAEAAANLAEPWPLKICFDTVLKAKAARGLLSHAVFWSAGVNRITILRFASLAVLLVAAIGAASNYIEQYLTASIGQYVAHDLRRRLYAHVQRLSLAYHDLKSNGDLISRLTGDIDAVQGFIASGVLGAFVNAATLTGMLVVMCCLNWRFTLIALSIVPLLFLAVFRYTRQIKQVSREARKKQCEIVSVVQEALSAIRVIKAFAREDFEHRRLVQTSLESVRIALRLRNLKATLSPAVDMIVALGTCLVLWFGGQLVLSGALSAGSLVLFIWYLGKMYKPMRDLSKTTDAYFKAAVGYERIREVLETDQDVIDLPGARRAPGFRGEISLDNVSFGYGTDCATLKQVSLTVEPGQIAALVGPTGGGKTTIVSLIARFYDPISGTVKIDGTDVRLFQQKSLRDQISFVLQETLLFHAPVWYNIAYGKPEAARDEIRRAAMKANAHEFIQRLPQGYDTVLGERGMTLSGGERQRIAIARAVIRDSPILVLDEATSGLDALSEQLVFEALGDLMKGGRTSIIVAHKLSTVRSADVIFVVDNGHIVERGDHEGLLRRGGLYAALHELQYRDTEFATQS